MLCDAVDSDSEPELSPKSQQGIHGAYPVELDLYITKVCSGMSFVCFSGLTAC